MRVVVAADSVFCRKSLEHSLTLWGYDVVLAKDGTEAWDILCREAAPALVVLDCTMPESSGPGLCKAIRQRLDGPYVYVIVLSAKCEQQDLLEGFELGADDYVKKPFHELELKARLGVGTRILRAQQELLEIRRKLQFAATHDSMTTLWNNGAITDILKNEIHRAKRHHSLLSICLIDLDHFKRINDTHGHPMGDEVLRASASRLRHALREYDSLGRCGGEEFLAVLPGCSAHNALTTAERMRLGVRRKQTELPVAITASIGVCEWQPDMSVEELLSEADARCMRRRQLDGIESGFLILLLL